MAVLRCILSQLTTGIVNESIDDKNVSIFPNPVSRATIFHYVLKQDVKVTLKLLDIKGNLIQAFFYDEEKQSGEHFEKILFPANLVNGNYVLALNIGSLHIGIPVLKQ